IGGILNVGLNIVLYFLGLFNPITAIITLGISFLFLNIIMRMFVRREIDKKIVLIDKQIIKYIIIAVSVVFVDFLGGLLINNLLIKLVFVFGVYLLIYLL